MNNLKFVKFCKLFQKTLIEFGKQIKLLAIFGQIFEESFKIKNNCRNLKKLKYKVIVIIISMNGINIVLKNKFIKKFAFSAII